MTVKQMTLQIPNKPGDMAKISALMGDAGVNILGILVSTATPDGSGLLRFVPDNPSRAFNVLTTVGRDVTTQDVIAVNTPHHAGGLLAVLKPLHECAVNIDYIYPCTSQGKSSILILGIPEEMIPVSVSALEKNWIQIYGEELYNM